MCRGMTTHLHSLPGDTRETFTQSVARRLRGQLAERNISGLKLANLTGLGRSTINRRLQGETALNTDELDAICRATGIDLNYLMTGKQGPRPGGPEGGTVLSELSPFTESNRRPSHYNGRRGLHTVIPWPGNRGAVARPAAA